MRLRSMPLLLFCSDVWPVFHGRRSAGMWQSVPVYSGQFRLENTAKHCGNGLQFRLAGQRSDRLHPPGDQ